MRKVRISKKNNVKEANNMRKLSEMESFLFVEAMQNMMEPDEGFKKIVHEHLFDNMVTLFKNEGFDMSFLKTPAGMTLKSEANEVAKQIEEGGDFEDSFLATLYNSFIGYLEMDDIFEEFVAYVNEQPVDMKMENFFSKFVFCMRSNYNERLDFIRLLCAKGQELKENGKMIAYDRVANYLSLLVYDCPSVEISRNIQNITNAYIKKIGA